VSAGQGADRAAQSETRNRSVLVNRLARNSSNVDSSRCPGRPDAGSYRAELDVACRPTRRERAVIGLPPEREQTRWFRGHRWAAEETTRGWRCR
jgi:hypothetical protein